MKTYTVTLGGQTLELLYRMQDRDAVENMFPRSDNTPGSMVNMVGEHCLKGGGSFSVMAALLWAGLAHLGSEWDLSRVRVEFGKIVQASVPGGVSAINTAIYKAVFTSGVLGFVRDPDADTEKETGKDPAA